MHNRFFVCHLIGLLVGGSGCGGELLLENPGQQVVPCAASADCGLGLLCDDGVCAPSQGACSAEFPNGDCPKGRECRGGACVCVDAEACGCPPEGCLTPPPIWCECEPEQACTDAGECVDLDSAPEEQLCSPTTPSGLCPAGDVCSGGNCVPVAQAPCAPERPDGYCAAGLDCVSGRCIPTSDRPCSQEFPDGLCGAGRTCAQTDAGDYACEVQECAAATPTGACDEDEYCNAGSCEGVPCSPNHLGGLCPADGQYCSAAGECIDTGTCLVREDCGIGQYCSVTAACVAEGTCFEDADCTERQAFERGYVCTNDFCVPRSSGCMLDADCIASDYCSQDGFCLARGQCEAGCQTPRACAVDADCPSPETFCSSAQDPVCLEAGSCLVDADCADEERCSADGKCISGTQCADTSDCPPGYTCNSTDSVCEPIATCDSNAITFQGCAEEEISCCAADGACCSGGQRCSFEDPNGGVCLPQQRCLADADCLSVEGTDYFTCDTNSFTCVPATPCGECPNGQYCSFAGGCVPEERCVTDRDCPSGQRCNAEFRCEPDGCDAERFSTGSVIQPNMMVVLDRSGSMNVCGGTSADGYCGDAATSGGLFEDVNISKCCEPPACRASGSGDEFDDDNCTPGGEVGCDRTTFWRQAVDVTKQLTQENEPRMNFGLSTYPEQCAGTRLCDVPIAERTCQNDQQCPDGQMCGPLGECIVASCTQDGDCPNDSYACDGSTNTCVPASCSVGDFDCAFYGYRCSADSNTCQRNDMRCNWLTCSGRCNGEDNDQPGQINTPVAPQNSGAIASFLEDGGPDDNGIHPGGGTPTGPTLRNIIAEIQDPADEVGLSDGDRENAILLLTDGEANNDDTDISVCEPDCSSRCGGLCDPCDPGEACERALDCKSRICRDGLCRAYACGNGVLDGSETDVDCGGSCGPCAAGKTCTGAGDCASGICNAGGVCAVPSCDDDTQNGAETDTDCGGGSCDACVVNDACKANDDCASGVCQGGACRPSSCGNGTQDGSETGVDCGGDDCAPCIGHCGNGEQDGGETDVDCGGPCDPCPAGRTCSSNADCDSATTIGCGDGGCNSGAAAGAACRVNRALDRLYSLNPRVRTFVVGFNFGSVSANLNCHAVHGRSAKWHPDPNCDDGGNAPVENLTDEQIRCRCRNLGRNNCDQDEVACYYSASDAGELSAAFDTIVTQVASCSFFLADPPSSALDVYLQRDDGNASTSLEALDEFVDFAYFAEQQRLTIFDATQACADVKAGTATPVVVYRQCGGGGG